MNRVVYCQISQNRETYLRRNFDQVLAYVDQAVLVDSGSADNTKALCESLAPKVIYVPFPWCDSFKLSWEKSLEHVPVGDFCLICDDDELPSKHMCEQLRSIATNSENGNYTAAEFRCHPISIGMDNKEVDLGTSNYFRLLMFKRGPDTRWEGTMHQYITGLLNSDNPNHVKRFHDLEYFHIKHIRDEIRAACRNWFIGGVFFSWCKDIGILGPDHDELMSILARCHPDVKVFNHLGDHIINGTVNKEVLAWIVYYYNYYKNGCPGECYLCYYVSPEERGRHDYFNEIRAFYRYVYEITHPEWEPLSFEQAKSLRFNSY